MYLQKFDMKMIYKIWEKNTLIKLTWNDIYQFYISV